MNCERPIARIFPAATFIVHASTYAVDHFADLDNVYFEVVQDPNGKSIWALPMSWFARGASGQAWLPTDSDAREIFEFDPVHRAWKVRWEFHDTIADVALYTYTAHAPEGGIPLAAYPQVLAWIGRIEALPGFVGMKRSPVIEPVASHG